MAPADRLAEEIRARLGPPPELGDWPLVSLVVLNRDGLGHLRRLLTGLAGRTDYPRFELILVDNASSDESVDFMRRAEAPFPISIVANAHNESFSDACNQGRSWLRETCSSSSTTTSSPSSRAGCASWSPACGEPSGAGSPARP